MNEVCGRDGNGRSLSVFRDVRLECAPLLHRPAGEEGQWVTGEG